MTQLPPDELAALPDDIAPGTFVLELGNKKNSTGLYRNWYMEQGLEYECIDWNGLDGAWKFDMRQPGVWMDITLCFADTVEKARFPLITNFGFTEHVGETLEEQIECWRNIHSMLAVEGCLSICMPLMPYWKGHGRWMPTVEWYESFASMNEYEMEGMRIWDRVRPTFVARMIKKAHVEFLAPDEEIVRSDL